MSLHREHARVATRSGMASLRDLEARDIAVIVSYWHGGAADFFTMNVDIAKLGTPDNARSRFEASLRTGDPNHRIKAYFDTSATQRLIHLTSVRNQGVNRMLDKYVPVAETRWVEKLDGAGAPGDYHLRYVRREDLPRLFARAAEIARQ